MKVLTIGGATYDVFIGYDSRAITLEKQSYVIVPEGQKCDLRSIEYSVGGGATNSAVSFSRLGFDVRAFFKIGNDFQGAYIVDQLKSERITVHHVVSQQEKTSSSFIVSSPSGNSPVLVYRGANSTIVGEDIPWGLISSQDQIYITSLSGVAAELLPSLTEYAHHKKIAVAVNPGGGQLKHGMHSLCKALAYIDIFILNKYEAQLFLHALQQESQDKKRPDTPFDIAQYMNTVLQRGPKIVVVTDGADGVYVAYDNEIIFHKSMPVDVVNTVGAGDAFGSCFVAHYARSNNIQESVRAGILNSAAVIGCVSSQEGLLDEVTLGRKIEKIDRSFLVRYPGN